MKCPSCGHEFHPKTEAVPDGFDEFWRVYPRRIGKGQAIRAYRAALFKDTKAAILNAAIKFADIALTKDKEFVPHPSTWLNGMRWLDESGQGSADLAHNKESHTDPSDSPDNDEPNSVSWFHESWGDNARLLSDIIGRTKFTYWFKDVELSLVDGVYTLKTPSTLHRDWIATKFAKEVSSVLGFFRVI